MASFRELTPDEQIEYGESYVEDSINQDLEQIEELNQENEVTEQALSEAEVVLEKAIVYKALLRNTLFDETANEIALEVEKEVRDFIRSRLKELLGIAIPKQQMKLNFTEEEERLLKLWAGVLRNRPHLVNRPTDTPQEPNVKPASTKVTQLEPVLNKTSTPLLSKPKPAKAQPAKPLGRPAKPKAEAKKKVVGTRTIEVGNSVMEVTGLDLTSQTRPSPGGAQPLPQPSADALVAQYSAGSTTDVLNTIIQNARTAPVSKT